MFSPLLITNCKKGREGRFTAGGGKHFFSSVKNQVVNILGFGSHMASLVATQCYSWSTKQSQAVNEQICVLIKLYLQNSWWGKIWSSSYRLLTFASVWILWSLTPTGGAIGNWYFLRQGESIFFKDVAPETSTVVQWRVPWVQRQHKCPHGFKIKEEDLKLGR